MTLAKTVIHAKTVTLHSIGALPVSHVTHVSTVIHVSTVTRLSTSAQPVRHATVVWPVTMLSRLHVTCVQRVRAV